MSSTDQSNHLNMKVSVIIATYNEPKWLEKVLIGYEVQKYSDFEIVIADDGSGPETKAVIGRFESNSSLNIHHVWHPDTGYQKCVILNKAVLATRGKYLIFTDGDCIPRNDFVQTHVHGAEKGRFISGGALRLPMGLSQKINRDDICSQRAFDKKWLLNNGLSNSFKNTKLIKTPGFSAIMNRITPAKATWNGGNASCFKEYVLAVNGFNESMQYGGQDREFGERLVNIGLRGKQVRYSAICLHLDHKRGYKTAESVKKNLAIRANTRKHKITWTEYGIEK